MDQVTAQHLFQEGGVFVFLDVPVGTEVGIDCKSWNVGQQFRGIKMIPPGLHFIYYSAVGQDRQQGPRTGFFHNFKAREVLVREWDAQTEDMKTEPVDEAQQERIRSNRQELDRYLGTYPHESYKKWVSLTSKITPEVLSRLQPISNKICSVPPLVSESSTTASRRAAAEAAQHTSTKPTTSDGDDANLPRMECVPGTELRFTAIPRQKYPDGASPIEVTRCSLDHSFVLATLLDTVYSEDPGGLLAEVQFAFVCFLVGQVYTAFEQWKELVHLLCSCDQALNKYSLLFTDFIAILHYQVKEIPQDFFVDIVSRNNFLTSTLQVFFSNLESSCEDLTLREKGLRFRRHLESKFKWDFISEPEDDAPVVVDEV